VGSNETATRCSTILVCKNEEQLLERLDQAILEVIDNPDKANKPPLLDRYFDKRSKLQKILR
jgi:hypothetical protein